jgi:hypothetical protein
MLRRRRGALTRGGSRREQPVESKLTRRRGAGDARDSSYGVRTAAAT